MTNKITLVSEPDDVIYDGFRILTVDLDQYQSDIISSALLNNDQGNIILYVWNKSGNINWLMDKKIKSDIIIFNADSDNQIIVGYMSAQPRSHYLGTLRDLNKVNKNNLITKENCIDILQTYIGTYERQFN